MSFPDSNYRQKKDLKKYAETTNNYLIYKTLTP